MREGVHPRLAIQSDGAALCSSPAFTASHWRRGFEPNDLHDTLRAANATSSSTVSAGSARRRLNSTGPGRADLLTVSSTDLTWLVLAQIACIDVSDLSTPTTAGCLQPSRLRLRIRGGAHRRLTALSGGAASCLRHPTASHRRCGFKLTACSTCCGWRVPPTAAPSRRALSSGDSIRLGTAR